MRCLLFVSLIGLATSCTSAYKHAQKVPLSPDCAPRFQTSFSRVLYNTQVDVVGRHLSGLLIVKTMPDSSTRMVFASETGFKFFDFGFHGQNFTVYYILKQMDKKAVIKTLRKDFSLVLMLPVNWVRPNDFKIGEETYHAYARGKDNYYYITDANCTQLLRMERGSKRKRVTEVHINRATDNVADSMHIQHHNFNFTITLKRLPDNVDE